MDKWEKEFEERIRKKLSGTQVDFDPAAWDKIERRLYPAAGKTGWLSLWWLRAAAAVIVLAVAGIWAYTDYFDSAPAGAESADRLSSVREQAPDTGTSLDKGGERNPAAGESDTIREFPATREAGPSETGKSLKRFPVAANPAKSRPEPAAIAEPAEISGISSGNLSGRLASINTPLSRPQLKVPAGGTHLAPQRPAPDLPAEAEDDRMSFSLGLLAAPDLNGVGGFGDSKAGINLGIGLGIHFNDRLSLHTGIAYARKPYNALPSDYQMRYSPQGLVNIAAVCDVIDIPLNLRYTVYRRNANSIALNAGLSSYLMLREQYEYQYHYEDARQYEYRNENRHFMGVGNFGVELQRKISGNMAIGVEPFIKVPLTGIGHGNVRLISAGAALRLHLNLGKKSGVSAKK